MELIGKSPEQIEEMLRGVKRDRLIRIIQELTSLEPFFSPEQVGRARGITIASVMKKVRANELRAHLLGNRWRIPLSALKHWDRTTMVTPGPAVGVRDE